MYWKPNINWDCSPIRINIAMPCVPKKNFIRLNTVLLHVRLQLKHLFCWRMTTTCFHLNKKAGLPWSVQWQTHVIICAVCGAWHVRRLVTEHCWKEFVRQRVTRLKFYMQKAATYIMIRKQKKLLRVFARWNVEITDNCWTRLYAWLPVQTSLLPLWVNVRKWAVNRLHAPVLRYPMHNRIYWRL